MFKEFGMSKEVFINQDEGMFVALPITLDENTLTLETETIGGHKYVKAGSVVKEGAAIRGITAERYDITYGPAPARVVLEGYAWTDRLTNAAVAAASSLPRIVLIPYAVGQALGILTMKAIIVDGAGAYLKEVAIVNNALTLKVNDILGYVSILVDADVFLQGTPKTTVEIGGDDYDHGNITVSETNRKEVLVTPIGTNGVCANAGDFEITAPANAVKTAYGVGNLETVITLTVEA